MTSTAIEVSNLCKEYPGGHKALQNISFKVETGSVFGLLGPNGAGKSTLISVLSGITKLSSGNIAYFDNGETKVNNQLKQQIGIAPQNIALYELLSPIENLNYFGALHGMTKQNIKARSEELLTQFGLWEVKNKPVKQFSGGMKRRLNLIAALLHQPKILFLDEPTEGIDVQSRNAILEFLKQLNTVEKTTIIYTSHLLHEAEELCDKVLIIDGGKKVIQGNLNEIIANYNNDLQSAFLAITGTKYRDLV